MSNRTANALIHETSPYLQQHAYNPVQWYPWGDEALTKARSENKPIFLSIGYSSCHWCHVMAHESFEDESTAALMNELFINIKVDREERPDLDKIYQLSYQLLNQRGGGWPLNMFLTPDDHTPFFGGTYFPPTPRSGMPDFKQVLRRISAYVKNHPDAIEKQNSSLKEYLAGMNEGSGSENPELNAVVLDEARSRLESSYDERYGGFGQAPKFPQSTNIERLLRHWAATRDSDNSDDQALKMVCTTLQAMASGGIYDQLGGGFCRYSVDGQWLIPHFEKMLYDNGLLLAVYAEAYAATGDSTFKRICEETAAWVIREMQSPQGGYYSSLDADSEGEEGKFYVWKHPEVQEILTADEYTVASRYYGLDQAPNFEGAWHLHVSCTLEDIAAESALELTQVHESLAVAKQRLFQAREARIRPGRDEKNLSSWNGLMIKGMAIAGRRLGREDILASAERALAFVRSNTLWRDGRLLATFKDDKAHLMAYLDDYVFLADGILSLLEARWRDEDLAFVIEIMEVVLAHFSAENGGFYFTADDHEQLIQRPRTWMDEAVPAGNGIAAQVLLRLGYVLGEARYISAAEKTVRAAWHDISLQPEGHSALLSALEDMLSPPETVILRGDAAELAVWKEALTRNYTPGRLVLAIPADAEGLPGSLAGNKAPEHGVMAYVCQKAQCLSPIATLEGVRKVLGIPG